MYARVEWKVIWPIRETTTAPKTIILIVWWGEPGRAGRRRGKVNKDNHFVEINIHILQLDLTSTAYGAPESWTHHVVRRQMMLTGCWCFRRFVEMFRLRKIFRVREDCVGHGRVAVCFNHPHIFPSSRNARCLIDNERTNEIKTAYHYDNSQTTSRKCSWQLAQWHTQIRFVRIAKQQICIKFQRKRCTGIPLMIITSWLCDRRID